MKLAHVANLLRQHRFHHLPVARVVPVSHSPCTESVTRMSRLLFEGVLNSHDISLSAALANQESSSEGVHRSWQEQRVVEVMHQAPFCVTPTTSVGAAAQLLVERGLDSFPVVEYSQEEQETQTFLIGLLTRSDLLLLWLVL